MGTVVNGILNAGSVKVGDSVSLGPDANGSYQTTVIRSMQRKRFVGSRMQQLLNKVDLYANILFFRRADVTRAEAGQCVSLALKRIRRAEVRKGMVLVPKADVPPRGT